eukprot:7372227-Lingulodinium_polyedra.AAC.1
MVRARIRGRQGRARTSRRSVGMGGPPSTLMWHMGYDPSVEAIGGLIFVDDLAGLHRGPRRALRVQYFLLAAGHAAGLS